MARTYVVLRKIDDDTFQFTGTCKADSARSAIDQTHASERGDLTTQVGGAPIQYTAVPARNWTTFDVAIDLRVNYTEVELFVSEDDDDPEPEPEKKPSKAAMRKQAAVEEILDEDDARTAEDYADAEAEKVAAAISAGEAMDREAERFADEDDPVTDDEDLWGGGDDK